MTKFSAKPVQILKSDRFCGIIKIKLLYTFLNVTRRERVISHGLWLWVCNEMGLSYLRLCEGAKEMLLVDNVDDKEFLFQLITAMYDELPEPKKRRK